MLNWLCLPLFVSYISLVAPLQNSHILAYRLHSGVGEHHVNLICVRIAVLKQCSRNYKGHICVLGTLIWHKAKTSNRGRCWILWLLSIMRWLVWVIQTNMLIAVLFSCWCSELPPVVSAKARNWILVHGCRMQPLKCNIIPLLSVLSPLTTSPFDVKLTL